MNILFIGDVVGRPGRGAIKRLLPDLKMSREINIVIANGENSAGGAGITLGTAQELFDSGVDVITSGDHLWDQKEVLSLMENEPRFVRPHNYPPGTPGNGSFVFVREGQPPVAVLNLQGRTFMPDLENPFRLGSEEVRRLKDQASIVFVDFHAEATSEKIALGRFLDGEVSAVIGTHTHVQTADEKIFPRGTAFLCDAGFTGAHDGVIGRESGPVIQRFITNQPQRFTVSKRNVLLQGAVVGIEEETGIATSIERISESMPEEAEGEAS